MTRRKTRYPCHLDDERFFEQPGIPPRPPRACEALENCSRKSSSLKGMGWGGDQVCDAERR